MADKEELSPEELARLEELKRQFSDAPRDEEDQSEEDADDLDLELDPTNEFGRIEVTEAGITLNLGGADLDEEREEAASREVTEEDLIALATADAELNQRWPETKIEPSLDRMEMLMDFLGSPQRSFRSIHVSGTNGKTSTVRMIESLLRAFHRRTGRTTSPHLQLVTERVAVDGEPIHPADFVRVWEEIKPFVEMVDARSEVPMSKFEVLTAIAYAAFADAPVDVAVVEVGMGGTWDATNVINADVNVVMPVGLDHADYLGDTIEQVAAEKAGIIKPRWDTEDLLTPPDNVAVIAGQDPEAMNVILQRAIDVDAAVARAGAEFDVVESAVAVGGQTMTLRGIGGVYEDLFLPLSGEHQARNAAVALAAVETFFGAGGGRALDLETVREGFATVTSPGRLERVRSTPTTFIDATHNPHGAHALGQALERDFDFSRLIGVVGVLDDKDYAGILRELEPHLSEIVVTQNSSPRAVDAYELAEAARDIFGEERVHVDESLPGAYALAVELAEDADVQSGAGVIITGSVVTAGEARTMFGKDPQ